MLSSTTQYSACLLSTIHVLYITMNYYNYYDDVCFLPVLSLSFALAMQSVRNTSITSLTHEASFLQGSRVLHVHAGCEGGKNLDAAFTRCTEES